jgi:1-acyl-sn-glycerol-3-phosphate acyltransferase
MLRETIAFAIRLVTGVRAFHETSAERPARIYFANHSSHLDFVVIWAALPGARRRRTRPVAAADYWEAGPVRRWLAGRVFHAVLIPRGKVTRTDDPIGRMAEALAAGSDLILFPEGTRSPDGQVADFRAGLHALARRHPQAELVPVFLDNLNRILPKGEFLMVPLMGSATFGPPCEGPRENETRHDFLHRIRDSVLALAPHHSENSRHAD